MFNSWYVLLFTRNFVIETALIGALEEQKKNLLNIIEWGVNFSESLMSYTEHIPFFGVHFCPSYEILHRTVDANKLISIL